MDLKQIKELIQLLEKSGLNKLTIKEKGMEISLEKGDLVQPAKRAEQVVIHSTAEVPMKPAVTAPSEEECDHKNHVKSPMIGTFYRSPGPGKPNFIEEGQMVEKGQVLCIIEAMKVMNEIKSDRKGVLAKAVVENGHPVEFGQALFVIE
jgi:acetyl-CoA carboxylase biotin carboxyl carrier protein